MKGIMRKFLTAILLVILLVGNITNLSYVTASKKEINSARTITKKIPQKVKHYAEDKLQDALQLLIYYADTFEVNETEIVNMYLGAPFVVFDWDSDYQDAIYYFPVQTNDRVIATMNVMSTSAGLTFSLDQDMVSILNDINYAANSEEYILYKENEEFVAERRKNKTKLGKFSDDISSMKKMVKTN